MQFTVYRLLDRLKLRVDAAFAAATLPPEALIARRHAGIDKFNGIHGE